MSRPPKATCGAESRLTIIASSCLRGRHQPPRLRLWHALALDQHPDPAEAGRVRQLHDAAAPRGKRLELAGGRPQRFDGAMRPVDGLQVHLRLAALAWLDAQGGEVVVQLRRRLRLEVNEAVALDADAQLVEAAVALAHAMERQGVQQLVAQDAAIDLG